MKKIGLFLAALLCCAGCYSPLTRPARVFLDSVGAEYRAYVTADAKLKDDEKRIRLQHVDSFARAVEEANK